MKRLLSLLLVVCLVFGLAAQAIAATLTPSVNPTEVQAGDQVVVTLTLDEAVTGLTNLEYNLYYNADVFGDPTGAPLSGNTALQMSIPKTDANGTYVSVSYVDTASEGSGSFAVGPFYQVTFTAKETVTAVTESSFQLVFKSAADTSWKNPGLSADSTAITVTVKPQAVPATSVILSAETLTLTVGGEAATLTATVEPENATDSVVWSVEPEGIVNVDNGTVTAVAAGTATITATAGSVHAACAVTVEAAQAECDHAETEKETSYTAGETAGTHVKTVTCKACSQPVGDPVTEDCVGTEADPHKCVCGAACNQLPVLKEGVTNRTVVVQTGKAYQVDDLVNGSIFTDADRDSLTYSYRKSNNGGETWGEWMSIGETMEHGSVNKSLSNSTAGTYTYEFKANDGYGDSEARWLLTLETSDVVPANVKFYLGQDHNYKTNGSVMPVLELYKTAGLDEDLYDYVGWFTKGEETVYVYNPHDYEITDGEKDYVTVDGQQYELFGYEKVTFTDSLFGAAPAEGETATPSGTVVNNYNMFYATITTDRYSTRVYGYNATTSAYDVYLGGQSMELPMEKDIYGNGGNDIYLRQIDIYTTSKKLDNTYFTAEDYYAEVIMPITGGMIHAGDPYVSGNYAKFPFFSWAAGNGSLYNAYVYPYDTDNYIFSQQINLTTPAGTSVIGKAISISTVLSLTVTVPETADFELYFQYNNFNTKEMAPMGEAVANGNGTKTLTFKVSKNNQNYTWRMTDTTGKYVTRAGWLAGITAATAKTYTFDETSPTDKKTHSFRGLGTAVGTRDEADLQVFLSASGFKSTTEKTRIRAYRMWEIINSDPGNIMVEPDFNIQVLQGNASDISLVSGGNVKNNWIDVTPTTTDIVAVTYDALDVWNTSDSYGTHGGLFPATNPERTNVFIITNEAAGTAAAHIPFNGSKSTDRGSEWDYNYDTWSYLNSDTAPKLDFTVTGTGAVNVSYATVITNDALVSTLSDWTDLTAENGTYYVDLLPFRTAGTKGGTVIIKMTDSTGTSYALVRVAEMTATVTNITTPGEPFTPGDQVSITFDGLYRSINKISGIFNPLAYYLRYTSGGTEVNGSLGQYQQMDKASISLTIPEDLEFPEGQTSMEYNFTNGYVYGSMYSAASPFQSMYYITDTGVGTNFSAVGVSFVLSRLADIPITVQQKVLYDMKLAFSDGEKPITNVTVSITDPNGNALTPDENGIYQDLVYGDYHMDIAAPGFRRNTAPLHLGSADASAVVDGILVKTILLEKGSEGCWDGTSVSEPKTDANGVYQIGTGAELAWFAQTVNAGTTDISAVLTADIDLGGYDWTPIGSQSVFFTGNLDGQNHKITGLYIYSTTGATYQGLFSSTGSSTTISNLTVEGSIYSTSSSSVSQARIGGVSGNASGTTFTNVHANVDITIDRVKGNWANVGGLTGLGGTFTNCSNSGDISGYNSVGGIAGTGASSITGCFNSGNISGYQKLGGITGSNSYGAIIACYNTGEVTGTSGYVAGIIPETGKAVTNCFNTGTISIANNTGAIIGRLTSANAVVTNNYYLKDSHSVGIGTNGKEQHEATMVTAETLASRDFVKAMNTGVKNPAYAVGTTHPILRWQNPAAEVIVPVLVSAITLNKAETTITKGLTEQLSAGITPENAENKTLTWTSSNTGVATVDANGLVTAVEGGTATITAAATDGSEVTATCTVTVPVSTTGVTLNKETTSIIKGGTETLVATVAPANATNQNVTWSSSNTAVATVDANGLVTAVDGGTATITVTAADGSFTDTCEVTVTVPVESVSLNKTETTLNKGQNETLTATVTPANATNQNVTWTSSDETVATVENGVVTAVDGGTATITATTEDGSKTATCTVTVIVPVTGVTLNKETTSITKGGTETLVATVAPANATNQNVTWSSSNTAVATVEDGVVTAVDGGTATITVTTTDGSFTDTCEVTVIVPVESVSLDQTELNLKHGDVTSDPVTLTATVLPANATNKAVAWTSSDETVAKVENGVVTPVGAGTAVITVVTVDGSKKATCEVTVVENYAVTGQVLLHDGTQPGRAVNLKIMRGAAEIMGPNTSADAPKTETDGTYTLRGLEAGTYNLIATENDGRTTTALIEVKANASVGTVKLPEANVSSELAVTKDTPEVVVGGLNELAELHGDTKDAEKHVTVSMNVAKQEEATASDKIKPEIDAIEKVINDTSRKTVFVTIDLEKRADGENTATAITDTGDVLLEIIVPFDLEGKQSVKVYRYHGSAVDELRETANADGEKIELDREKNQIVIHAKKFSTYAISTSETEDAPVEPEKPKTYRVSVIDGTGSGDYEAGKTVQIQAVIPNGYRFKQWVVIPNTVKLASTTSAATTFVMPETTVTILAEFEKIEVSQKKEETVKKMSFTDVKTSDWFYDEVKYVYEAGIMTGLSAAKFGPNQTTTRGMIVTMLYRLEGSPKVEGMSTFSDVNPNAYFADAIKWAAKNKIVEGYDGKFAPNDAITREQMATILYRYCKYKGYDVSAKGDLSVFADAAQISDYAKDAMAWAVGIGLYNGRGDGTIVAPQDNATRAEVAAILMRFMERKK